MAGKLEKLPDNCHYGPRREYDSVWTNNTFIIVSYLAENEDETNPSVRPIRTIHKVVDSHNKSIVINHVNALFGYTNICVLAAVYVLKFIFHLRSMLVARR